MTKTQKLRRVAILSLHCIRNIAYYLERREEILRLPEHQFWRTIDGNFMDIGVLEWCKLFADTRGKNYWKCAVSDRDQFFNMLIRNLGCNRDQFENFITDMKTYRDKFVAHLDEENTMQIPHLDMAKKSVFSLYNYLLDYEKEDDCFDDFPLIADYFSRHTSEVRRIYDKQITEQSLR